MGQLESKLNNMNDDERYRLGATISEIEVGSEKEYQGIIISKEYNGSKNPVHKITLKQDGEEAVLYRKTQVMSNSEVMKLDALVNIGLKKRVPEVFYDHDMYLLTKEVKGKTLAESDINPEDAIKSFDDLLIEIYSKVQKHQKSEDWEGTPFKNQHLTTFSYYIAALLNSELIKTQDISEFSSENRKPSDYLDISIKLKSGRKRDFEEIHLVTLALNYYLNVEDEQGYVFRTISHMDAKPTNNVLFDDDKVTFIDLEMADFGLPTIDRASFANHRLTEDHDTSFDDFVAKWYDAYSSTREESSRMGLEEFKDHVKLMYAASKAYSEFFSLAKMVNYYSKEDLVKKQEEYSKRFHEANDEFKKVSFYILGKLKQYSVRHA